MLATTTESTVIDHNQVFDFLEQAVAARGGEYVDPGAPDSSCYYLVNHEPSCIAGTALSLAGVPNRILLAMDEAAETVNSGPIIKLLRDAGFDLTSGAQEVIREAQCLQDHGNSWGDALDGAREILRVLNEGQ